MSTLKHYLDNTKKEKKNENYICLSGYQCCGSGLTNELGLPFSYDLPSYEELPELKCILGKWLGMLAQFQSADQTRGHLVKAFSAETLTLDLIDSFSPLVIRYDGFMALQLPIRLQPAA